MTDAERAEYDDVVRQLMQKCEQLAAENASLKANNASAHQTLRAIYADSTQPATVRVRAAQSALGVETPSLKPQEQPLELTAEPIIPLAQLVEERRARMNKWLALTLAEREAMIKGVGGDDGNGDDDTAG
jgi:hypothetical protein